MNLKDKKAGFASFVLPRKPSNKVGITVTRSQSVKHPHMEHIIISEVTNDLTISRRPLSFDTKHKKMQGTNTLKTTNLARHNSLSDSNVCSNEYLTSQEEVREKSISHENLLESRVLSSLYLIPTSKARQRNFLQGKLGANSLLGPCELDRVCPNREITIFVGTWNMNGHSAPKELNDFVLPVSMEHVPDILSFGTQESTSERFDWEASLQETIGPSHLLLHSVSLGTLHLATFVRRDLIWYVSIAEESSLSVRPGTAFRTKGAVATSFSVFGTSFLFVTAHLTAHEEKVKERVSDVKKIVHSMDLPKLLPCKNKSQDSTPDDNDTLKTNRRKLYGKLIVRNFDLRVSICYVTQNFDYVFWFGDLNFRLATPRAKVLEWLSNTNFPLPAHLPHGYMHHDQLCSVLADGAAFRGFNEAKITFPPTYKYDPGTQNFDSSSKNRTPAYTDRILYKQKNNRRFSGVLENPPLQCLIYDSVPSITTSDHKPVWGVFKAHLRPGLDTIPLAAGLFNRDVYLEGLKRRATTLNSIKNDNSVCSVQ